MNTQTPCLSDCRNCQFSYVMQSTCSLQVMRDSVDGLVDTYVRVRMETNSSYNPSFDCPMFDMFGPTNSV